ncbi:hypothetical protein BO79DRAFT_33890 [Aspergillus costaricaensis CBS 115574]|uniref:Uncharacterized protein n=1 Tax=Aspergillus costaricaensis CBS 115574 TaxID=1448317 RepID=A0ACD1I9P8_9EURO|nr:hypothetical protein BO79DRAFT_33890 [Aspergillus costaricaensis CBS 115574]RAK86998.1 hypothetical protein BO79DRAFT_33890 [Aspergillus costaricaensis CBS 115574]
MLVISLTRIANSNTPFVHLLHSIVGRQHWQSTLPGGFHQSGTSPCHCRGLYQLSNMKMVDTAALAMRLSATSSADVSASQWRDQACG